MTKKESFQKEFEDHVREGLTSHPKFLSSKYIYDDAGDQLFQQIMELPEYYLTRAEYNVIDRFKTEISAPFQTTSGFDLIELGAGDGKKTKLLLEQLYNDAIKFTYIPIDISQHSIDALTSSIEKSYPGMDVLGEQGTYFKVLKDLAKYNKRPKLILVLGSNIGNLQHPAAIEFLKQLQHLMSDKDGLFIGFDQKKDPMVIQDAYSDKTGVTQKFNRNLLQRINKEMGANFSVNYFDHWESYNPETGTAKSFLIATKACEVSIKKLDLIVNFKPWETIHTEISQKYDDEIVEWLAQEAGLKIKHVYEDDKKLFKNYSFIRN
jgi:dimethylhistidine N-methyltransferase